MRGDPNPPLALRLSARDVVALETIQAHLMRHKGLASWNRIVAIKQGLWAFAETLWEAEEAERRAGV